jgi:hypothetical protein
MNRLSLPKSEIQSLARSLVAMFARQFTAMPTSYWLLLNDENSFLNKLVVKRITSVDSVKDWKINKYEVTKIVSTVEKMSGDIEST